MMIAQHLAFIFVPRPAFEIIKVRKMWVKRKMQKNTTIILCFNRLQSN